MLKKEIKNLFKNNKLEEWSVGLKNHLYNMIKMLMIKKWKLLIRNEKQFSSGENLEEYYDNRNAEDIENEELAMTIINDDDVPEGYDGDEQY